MMPETPRFDMVARAHAPDQHSTAHAPAPSGRSLAAGGLAIGAVTFGFARYGYGLFTPYLRADFGLSTATLGALSSASYGAYLVALAATGALVSRRGPRLPVLAASLFAGVGTVLVATATTTPALAAGVVLAGASAGFAWAPFSDATLVLPSEHRDRAMAWISSGCTFALIVVAPLALIAGDAWRAVWAAFAASALITALHNARHVPSRRVGQPSGSERSGVRRWLALAGPHAWPLLAGSVGYTVVGSVYWTFAVDIAHRNGLAPWTGPVLWGLIGVGGTVATGTSRLVASRGLTATRGSAALALMVALLGLAAAPGSLLVVFASGLIFGAGYMVSVALLPIWSARTWPERPATGLISAIAASGIGAIGGPLVVGWLAGSIGLPAALALSVTALGAALMPTPRPRLRWVAPERLHRPRRISAHRSARSDPHGVRSRGRRHQAHHRRRG